MRRAYVPHFVQLPLMPKFDIKVDNILIVIEYI